MKKWFLLPLFLVCVHYAIAGVFDKKNFFLSTKVDLGKVKPQDNEVIAFFNYHNQTGRLVTIMEVKKSCGCVNVVYPTHPVSIGESGCLEVKINTKGISGYFEKSVMIYTLGIKPTILKIKGEIQ